MLKLFNRITLSVLALISSFNSSFDNVEIIEKDLPIMYITIEKINVRNPIYDKESINNDIDKNVIIMKEANMPTDKFGNVILGAHSGIGEYAYFKYLNFLEIGDEIIIDYKNKMYKYLIKSIYTDNKDGKIVIRRKPNKNTLTLFTCNPSDNQNYLVIIAELE